MSQQNSSAPAADNQPTIAVDSLWMPRASSTFAEDTDAAFNFVTGVNVVFFVLVVAPMIYFAFRYKRKSETERTSPIDHSFSIEVLWTSIPTVLLIYLFWVGMRGWVSMQVPPNETYDIQVQGQMFNWTFTYPNGAVTTELYVPKGKPVKLIMSSKDVIHSFYVPEFRVKQDVVPGLYTTMWFEATQAIESAVECTEYCGDGHSKMLTKVFVLEQADFEKAAMNDFLPDLAPVDLGKKRYQSLCASCHSIDGSKIQGPSFKGLFGRQEQTNLGAVTVDENYIRESILEPQKQIVVGYPPSMPTFQGVLKDKDIEGIIAFLKEQK